MHSTDFSNLKVAIVADWLTNFAGAEQVILQITKVFPDAPIYTSVHVPKKVPQFKDKDIRTTFLQKIPIFYKKHQLLLKWMPLAFETLDLSEYDIVISSSHACSKGIITKPETLHVCYCHTPLRAAWDNYHDYIARYKMNPLIKKMVPHMMTHIRMWDRLAADRVDHFISNSSFISRRIQKYYRRESTVIYPSIDSKKFDDYRNIPEEDFFLAVGRIVPNKNMELLVDTFNQMSDKKLKIIGSGIDLKRLSKKAKKNITFMGYQPDDVLYEHYAKCRALLFPQVEDFGIVALEAMASGKPVIAYKMGGALESIKEGTTGVFFTEQTEASLQKAIEEFETMHFNESKIREHAATFDHERFKTELKTYIENTWNEWKTTMH